MLITLQIKTKRQGLIEITDQIQNALSSTDIDEGLCTILIRHTSASLLIQENADPSAKVDLENWMNRFVSEGDRIYTHTLEGPDDMPAHIKSALTASTLSIPFTRNVLLLGTWQGVYLWEHRHRSQNRELAIHIGQ